jgi:predicted nucleic-acid-binding protein
VTGLDTNVLVRYLTRDDASQFARVAALLEGPADRGERFVIGTAVLCELVWVLESVYEYTREEIADALARILATAQFEVERPDDARQALDDFRASKADFSDALVGRVHRSLGAAHTLTFDRALKPLDTFRVL